MFVTVMPTGVKKGQAMFLGYLLSNGIPAKVKAYAAEQTASAACCSLGEVWWYPPAREQWEITLPEFYSLDTCCTDERAILHGTTRVNLALETQRELADVVSLLNRGVESFCRPLALISRASRNKNVKQTPMEGEIKSQEINRE